MSGSVPSHALGTHEVKAFGHQELAEVLLGGIQDGTYPVGERFPTEDQLCSTYGLARGTVRQALGRLERLGLVIRKRGAGTTVVSRTPVQPYQPVAQSADDIVQLARETRLLGARPREVVLDYPTARRLGTSPGRPWLFIEGARVWKYRSNAEPLCWSEHYFRAGTPSDRFLHPDFTSEDVTTPLEQTISAEILDEAKAAALGVAPGSAALVLTRRVRDRRRRLLQVGIYTHPADRYSLTLTVGGFPPSGG